MGVKTPKVVAKEHDQEADLKVSGVREQLSIMQFPLCGKFPGRRDEDYRTTRSTKSAVPTIRSYDYDKIRIQALH